MHHKRGKPKSGRAGCLMCKPWKRQGAKADGLRGRGRPAEKRAALSEREQRQEIGR